VAVPLRPRLAEHVLPRRHVVDGQEHVALIDRERGNVVRVGPREWSWLAAADGTRDLTGIVLAVRREASVSPDQVQELLARLDEIGFLAPADAPVAIARLPSERVRIDSTTPADRPIVPMPGLVLRCDRSGTCCRFYATVLMTETEAERARVLLPGREVGPVPMRRAFLPVIGSVPGEAFAPVARDGACGFLDDDGACAIHRAGGAGAKPVGCALFPATFVDDGEAIRVSAKTECACVLDSGLSPGDIPLVDPAWRTAWDLPAMIAVERLPDRIALTDTTEISRAELREFVRGWLTVEPRDVAAWAWATADACTRRPFVAPDPLVAPPEPELVRPYIEALWHRAHRRAGEDAQWRSERDAVRRTTTWIAATTLLLRAPDVLSEHLHTPAAEPELERFYLRAALYAYAIREPNVELGLRDLAVRLWVARAMADTRALVDGDPLGRRPLAPLDAVLRGWGLRAYVSDVD
jgi:lysine-N-methylase